MALLSPSPTRSVPRRANSCSVYIDGADVATAVFEPTGSWDTYAVLGLPIAVTGSVRLQVDAIDNTANGDEPAASQDKIEILEDLPPKRGLICTADMYPEMRPPRLPIALGRHEGRRASRCGQLQREPRRDRRQPGLGHPRNRRRVLPRLDSRSPQPRPLPPEVLRHGNRLVARHSAPNVRARLGPPAFPTVRPSSPASWLTT